MLPFLGMILSVLGAENRETIAFLNSLQAENGGFRSAPWLEGELSRPTLRTTRTAVRTYKLLGMSPPNQERIHAFLKSCHDKPSGGFSAEPGGPPDAISTSVALMILHDMEWPYRAYLTDALKFLDDRTVGFEQVRMVAPGLEQLRVTVPNAVHWRSDIERSGNQDGSFGSGPSRARETALNAMALMRLGGIVDKDRIARILLDSQIGDGGFGSATSPDSDLETCYRVVRVLHYLRESRARTFDLERLIDRCRNSDGGYGRRPGERSSLHGTYYATIVRDWLLHLRYETPVVVRFSSGDSKGVPPGWKFERRLSEETGQWLVHPMTAEAGNFALAQMASDGVKRQFHHGVRSESLRDVALTVRVHALSGEIDRGGGIIWRYRDAQNYYLARWNPLERNFRMYKVVAGTRTQLDTAQVPTDADAWHTIRVVTVGREIRGYFDGRLVAEAEDDEFLTPGRMGVWTKADAVSEFSGFQFQTARADQVEDFVNE